MRRILILIAMTLSVTAMAGVCRGNDEREGRPRFKGTELYSWKDAESEWVFKLVVGTNRLKLEEEIKFPGGQLHGVEELKKALARLAVGEYVAWCHQYIGDDSPDRAEAFQFPPKAMVEEIEKAAKDAEIHLEIDPALRE